MMLRKWWWVGALPAGVLLTFYAGLFLLSMDRHAKNLAIRLAVLFDAFGRACSSIAGDEPDPDGPWQELPKLPPYPEDGQGWVLLDAGLATRCWSLPIAIRESEDLLQVLVCDPRQRAETLAVGAARLAHEARELAEEMCRRYEIRDRRGNYVFRARRDLHVVRPER